MPKHTLPTVAAPLGGGTGILTDGRLVSGVTGHGRALSLSDGRVAMPGGGWSGKCGRRGGGNNGGDSGAAWWGIRSIPEDETPRPVRFTGEMQYVFPCLIELSGTALNFVSSGDVIDAHFQHVEFPISPLPEQFSTDYTTVYSMASIVRIGGILPVVTPDINADGRGDWRFFTDAQICQTQVDAVAEDVSVPEEAFSPEEHSHAPENGVESSIAFYRVGGMVRTCADILGLDRLSDLPATYIHQHYGFTPSHDDISGGGVIAPRSVTLTYVVSWQLTNEFAEYPLKVTLDITTSYSNYNTQRVYYNPYGEHDFFDIACEHPRPHYEIYTYWLPVWAEVSAWIAVQQTGQPVQETVLLTEEASSAGQVTHTVTLSVDMISNVEETVVAYVVECGLQLPSQEEFSYNWAA